MIIVKLKGGLGNQLFQYAFARKLSILKNTKLKFDLSILKDKTPFKGGSNRDYEIGIFNIIEDFATDKEIKEFSKFSVFPHKWSNKILRKGAYYLRKYFNLYCTGKQIYLKESNFSDKEVINLSKLPNDVYLEGYFSKLRYFDDIRNILFIELTLKNQLPDFINGIKNKILSTESISINIRRGDYVTDEIANSIFGLLPISYYKKAIFFFKNKFPRLTFFVFSDDIEWCKKKLDIEEDMIFADYEDPRKFEYDFHLMSLCKHNICANSTFSWWAAYLNDNPNKIVIAPKKWYVNEWLQSKYEKGGMIPDNWIKL